jgi:hypothetical protein
MREDENCAVKKENVIAGAVMYGSYLYLFCEFAIRRFVNIKPVKNSIENTKNI